MPCSHYDSGESEAIESMISILDSSIEAVYFAAGS